MIKKIIIHIFVFSEIGKGKFGLLKSNVTGYDCFVGGKIKAKVSTVITREAEEDTWSGARGQFVRDGGGEIRKT